MEDKCVGTTMTPEQQRRDSMAEVKIRPIVNGVLVKDATGWRAFDLWGEASSYIEQRLIEIRKAYKPEVKKA